ncbi:peptidoglycan bound internalin family protein, partial [Listeria ivanovii FSL F6-596]
MAQYQRFIILYIRYKYTFTFLTQYNFFLLYNDSFYLGVVYNNFVSNDAFIEATYFILQGDWNMKKIFKLLVIICVVIVSAVPFSTFAKETDATDIEQETTALKGDNLETTTPDNQTEIKDESTATEDKAKETKSKTESGTKETNFQTTSKTESDAKETSEPRLMAGDATETNLIPDANLRATINTKLGKPSDYIPTEAELGNLSGSLDLRNTTYTTLNGLQYLKKVMALQTVGITAPDEDLSYIAQMSSLIFLQINTSSFKTTAGLEPLTSLRSFQWTNNGQQESGTGSGNEMGGSLDPRTAYDFSFVTNNTTLRSLEIEGVYSVDPKYSFLSELPELDHVSITVSNMNDISSLAGLDKLTYLNVNANYISDLSPLKDHPVYKDISAGSQVVVLPERDVYQGDSLTINKPIKPDTSAIEYTLPANPVTSIDGDTIVMSNVTNDCIVNYRLYNYETGENDISTPGVMMDFTSTGFSATGQFNGQIIQPINVKAPAVDAAPVTVKYVDESGTKLADDTILNGKVDETYNTTAKTIENYQLKETPANQTGTFTSEPQTVTYIYTLNDGAPVTVKYVDENGQNIAPTDTLTGKIGTAYQTSEKMIDGYKLTKTPTNASGVFGVDAQTVTYEYEKET